MLKDYQALFNGLSEGFIVLDREGYIVSVNPAACSITGFPSKEMIGQPARFLYNNDSTKADYELQMVNKKGSWVSEGWKNKADGSNYWAELTFSILYDKDRIQVGYSCLLRDRTQKKLEFYDVRKSEERYRLMVDSVKDYAIFMLDSKGYIMSWNDGAKKTKGYSANEIIGKHFSTFYTTEDLESKKPENFRSRSRQANTKKKDGE
jgi:PAS domain S-box-containing protein